MVYPRIIFMGTSSFALPAMEQLHTRGYPVIGVVTQPDRPQGRGQKIVAPPVKLLAQKLGLNVFQPLTVKDPSFLEIFYRLKPDLVVVAAFGQILPKTIINFPPWRCLNIHPSLLPKYRGAAPINWAIIRGEKKTGVTIMIMNEGMDSGDILLQQETAINATENYGQLHDRLAIQGASMLIETLNQMSAGATLPQPQNEALVTFAPRLKKETGLINWHSEVDDILNLVRGLSPVPSAYAYLEGQILKIFHAEAKKGRQEFTPGTIHAEMNKDLLVAAANGSVFLKEVQLAGKRRMAIQDFLRGHHIKPGSILS